MNFNHNPFKNMLDLIVDNKNLNQSVKFQTKSLRNDPDHYIQGFHKKKLLNKTPQLLNIKKNDFISLLPLCLCESNKRVLPENSFKSIFQAKRTNSYHIKTPNEVYKNNYNDYNIQIYHDKSLENYWQSKIAASIGNARKLLSQKKTIGNTHSIHLLKK